MIDDRREAEKWRQPEYLEILRERGYALTVKKDVFHLLTFEEYKLHVYETGHIDKQLYF